MRILLQQIGTGLYLKEGGDWTKTPDEALCFTSADSAQSYCNFEAMPDAFVVMLPDLPVASLPENVIDLKAAQARA